AECCRFSYRMWSASQPTVGGTLPLCGLFFLWLTLICRTPSASSPCCLTSSGDSSEFPSLASSSSALPIIENGSSSSLSISLSLPCLDLLLDFVNLSSPSRNFTNPTVPPG